MHARERLLPARPANVRRTRTALTPNGWRAVARVEIRVAPKRSTGVVRANTERASRTPTASRPPRASRVFGELQPNAAKMQPKCSRNTVDNGRAGRRTTPTFARAPG
ncbi:hypothetical protein WS91_28405 [Burkholderia sp. MSMB1498]|nr:hypothetical protein WS91_28405 [Burkholderia sp. MSMB1498]